MKKILFISLEFPYSSFNVIQSNFSYSSGHGFSIWAHVVLPVVIAFLVFILIILIIVFCNRRRRQQQTPVNVEKEAVSNDHNPVISVDDVETDGPPLKGRESHSLITDSQPNVNVTTGSSQPKNNLNRDQERARKGRDNREQEWLNRDGQTPGSDHGNDWGRNWNRKQTKDSSSGKRQKDNNRNSGVSASSTLSWDRPNNHYLEEEAGSRSSTLKSTKSSGSDKRRPKSPPPYWHHSDPPPYRLPPPYLTNNSAQM